MKSVSEFANFTLTKGLTAKAALGEGKTPEEIETSLGEQFKLEGDRLKYFIAALDVASSNQNNLKRVLIMRLGEGEKAPAKAVQVEDIVYIPEFYVEMKRTMAPKEDTKGGRGGKGGGRGGKGGGRGGDRGGKGGGGAGKGDARPKDGGAPTRPVPNANKPA